MASYPWGRSDWGSTSSACEPGAGPVAARPVFFPIIHLTRLQHFQEGKALHMPTRPCKVLTKWALPRNTETGCPHPVSSRPTGRFTPVQTSSLSRRFNGSEAATGARTWLGGVARRACGRRRGRGTTTSSFPQEGFQRGRSQQRR